MMERGSCLPRSNTSSRNSSPVARKHDDMLPLPVQSSPRFPVRALLGHCFYRRIIIWSVTIIFFLFMVLFSGGVHTRHGRILDHLAGFATGDHYKGSTGSQYGGFEGSRVGHNGIETVDNPTSTAETTLTSTENEKNEPKPTEQKTEDSSTASETPTSEPFTGGPHWLKYKQ